MTPYNGSAKDTGGRNGSPMPAAGTSASASLNVTDAKLGAVMEGGGDVMSNTIKNNTV